MTEGLSIGPVEGLEGARILDQYVLGHHIGRGALVREHNVIGATAP